jgi:L-amino acid N-acyltransferase YncA
VSQAPTLRACRLEDIEQVQAIYAIEVRDGTASFEIEPPDVGEMRARFEAIAVRDLPYLVAEIDGRVAGYAYAAPYRPRPAYRYTIEDSVYIARWARRRGLGHALLDALIGHATDADMRQMVAIIGDSAHLASIRLHERAGFRTVGTLSDVGLKFGRWLDTVIMQRPLGEGSASMPPQQAAR